MKKRILITGKGSYIGTSFMNWVAQWPEEYEVDEISVRDTQWENEDFSKYDVIIHVAAIVHKKEKSVMKEQYYKVNTELPIKIAKKAIEDGVKQFIFFSSMSVFGIDDGIITQNTIPKPKNNYGTSKYQAEKKLLSLENSLFKLCIIRPPMVYGKNCTGNYAKLANYVSYFPYFPNCINRRSMIHIDNLSQFIKYLIDDRENGIFHPQNNDYVSTSKMAHLIAEERGRKMYLINFLSFFIRICKRKIKTINKLFGDLIYEKNMSYYKKEYCMVDLEESIRITERK